MICCVRLRICLRKKLYEAIRKEGLMVVSKTPLRASFFGGGTDFKDYFTHTKKGYGNVVSTALNMYVYIMVTKRFDDQIRVCYRIQEMVDHVDKIQHNIIREAMKIAGIEKGVDIVYSADIPISTSGVGLASSSAMAVGVLNALFAYKGIQLSPRQLAEYACEIEIGRLHSPIGIQDQFAVAFGGLKRYRFYPNGQVGVQSVICNPVLLALLKKRLMLFFTGMTRLASDILKDQKQNIADRMPVLDQMTDMVDESILTLQEGSLDDWGYMLDRAWELKRAMSDRINNPCIEEMYQKGKSAGALGGKILGAGGGGFLLLYVPEEKQEKVREALQDYRQIEFDFEQEGSRIIFME